MKTLQDGGSESITEKPEGHTIDPERRAARYSKLDIARL